MHMIELDTETVSPINLSCTLCKEKFKTNARLFKHLLNSHKDASTICRFCKRCFFSKQDYINHVSKHSNTNSHVYKCSICPQSFFSKMFLLEHQNKHSSVSNYVDGFTPKAKKSDDDEVKPKREYKKKAGKGKEKFPEVVRDKLMECLDGIVEHTEAVRPSVQTNPHIIKRYFQDGSEMDILDTNPGDTPSSQLIIHKKEQSVSKSLRELSKMQQSLNMLICDECDQLFASESFLNRHLATHTKRNLKYKYACKYCRMRYCAPNRLFAHFTKSHKNETPFSCEICSVTFVKKADFSSHIQSDHNNEGIIKFLQDGLIVYICKSKTTTEASSKIDRDSSINCDLEKTVGEDVVAAESCEITEGKSEVLSGELGKGKTEELRHWKGGLLKHWEGGSDNLSTEIGDKLSSVKGGDLNPGKRLDGDEVVLEKGDDLNPVKRLDGDEVVLEKGGDLNPEKRLDGDEVVLEKGGNLNPEKRLGGDEVVLEKGDDLNIEKIDILIPGGDEMCTENSDEVDHRVDDSIELGDVLGLLKVNSSKKTPQKGSRSKRPKFSVEISDTDESSWDEQDDEPLSVIRKSKSFKAAKKTKKQPSERCNICDVKLKAGSMKEHKQRHANNNRFHCHICKTSIKEEFKFHIHMKTHFQIDKFLCICGVRLPNKQLLDEHKRKVHSKDSQMQNLTMIRSVGYPVKGGKQSNMQTSQVLVKKLNENARVFNVQSSQGNVANVVQNLIRKVDPRAFGGKANTSPFKETKLNFGHAASPIGAEKKMNFTIKMISSQEAEERNKTYIKPIPVSDVKVTKLAFKTQQTSAPKIQNNVARVINKAAVKSLSLASPNIRKDAKQVGKRKYLKVNMQELIKKAATPSAKEVQLVTVNPLAHLMVGVPVSEAKNPPSRKSKNFDYESIIQKSLIDQMQ